MKLHAQLPKSLFLPPSQPWSINQPVWTICCAGHWEPTTSSEGRCSSLAYLVSHSLLEHPSSEGFLSACEHNKRLPVWSIPTSCSCTLGWLGLPRWRESVFEIINALIDLVCLHLIIFLEAQETQISSKIPHSFPILCCHHKRCYSCYLMSLSCKAPWVGSWM